MLDESTRSAILRLRAEGHGTRAIGEALGVSRGAVKRVLREGRAEVKKLERAEKAGAHRDRILELYADCKGNLMRVHEELVAAGATMSYPALTAFCRRHGIGHAPPVPAGRYDFAAGKEMQHDTSPHHADIGGRRQPVVTASVALCFSHMLFFQLYPRFRRFECKVFLTEALAYFEGACATCMIDNTHLVVLSGSGRDMVPVPEMAAFGERFGFEFVAHAIGNANRSARVERPFAYIENNFLAGRRFESFEDCNAQARRWCDRVNATQKRHLHASPRELFAVERTQMKRLPQHVPEVYDLHHRVVDTEGYVNVRRNRYSAPWTLIGRDVEVRESKERIEIFDGPRRVADHKRLAEPLDAYVTSAEHRPPRNHGACARKSESFEQRRVVDKLPEAAPYIARMRERGRGSARDLRWLLRMIDEYPRAAVEAAVVEACHYGMTDLDRLERMILRRIARDFFPRGGEGQ
jgi:hypothetical protein